MKLEEEVGSLYGLVNQGEFVNPGSERKREGKVMSVRGRAA